MATMDELIRTRSVADMRQNYLRQRTEGVERGRMFYRRYAKFDPTQYALAPNQQMFGPSVDFWIPQGRTWAVYWAGEAYGYTQGNSCSAGYQNNFPYLMIELPHNTGQLTGFFGHAGFAVAGGNSDIAIGSWVQYVMTPGAALRGFPRGGHYRVPPGLEPGAGKFTARVNMLNEPQCGGGQTIYFRNQHLVMLVI